MRRGAISPYFSRGMILRLEKDVIQKTVEKLCERIEGFKKSKEPLPIGTAYRAFTTDVGTEYTMGKSFNFLDRPDFYERWFIEFLDNVKLVHFVTHFPWFPGFAKRLPLWLRGRLLPKTAQLLDFHHVGVLPLAARPRLLTTHLTIAAFVGCRRSSCSDQKRPR